MINPLAKLLDGTIVVVSCIVHDCWSKLCAVFPCSNAHILDEFSMLVFHLFPVAHFYEVSLHSQFTYKITTNYVSNSKQYSE